jgi:hypothetical protein
VNLLCLLLLALTSPRAPACDGIPPELVNQDTVQHSYSLTCGKKVKEREIAPGEKAELEGFSGCTLKLGEHSETLHTEMVCTIAAGGTLTCDLL